jgi:hypothetical protein
MQTPYSAPYRDLNIIQKSLFQRIMSKDIEDKDAALLSRVWVEVEAFKREMRGIPRLLGHKLDELANARLATARRLSPSNPHTEPYTELTPEERAASTQGTPPAAAT